MTGGFLQLAATSNAETFLTTNPQISFFKSVFRKYTRFALESIDELGTDTALNKFTTTKFTIKVPRNGDLLTGAYLVFSLPAIYSGKTSSTNPKTYNFKWVKNLASHLIREATLKIGGVKVDTLNGEWINIYKELMASDEEKRLGSKLYGSIPDLYEPEMASGNNGNYPHIRSSLITDNTGFNVITIDDANTSTTFPSIPAVTLKIPLPFFFAGKSGLALPLIALQYHEVSIDFTLAPLYDLFTVIDTTPGSTSYGKRVKVTSSLDGDLGFEKFTKDPNFSSSETLEITGKAEFIYAFLDTEERKRFAVFEHEYLITQVNRQNSNLGITATDHSFKISSNNPTQYIVVVPKRDDQAALNQWNNYTNWIDNLPPYSMEYRLSDQYYDTTNNRIPFYTTSYSTSADLTPANSKRDIIESMTLKLNGSKRFSERKKEFFLYQQPLQHFKNSPAIQGIYVYSFSLDATSDQPTGACDFSVFNEKYLDITANIPDITDYTYKVNYDVYTVSYNILKIISGMGSLAFAY